jgi:hypothetical protein
MKKIIMLSAVLCCASAATASELRDISVSDIKASNLEIPLPSAAKNDAVKCGFVTGEITKLYLLAQTGKSLLYTYTDTEALFTEFTNMWQPILLKFDLKPTTTEYKDKFGFLNYESSDGSVVRDFIADKLDYDALNPAAIKKLQHELIEPLERSAMTPIASFDIKNEALRPTFNIYYLTKPDENPDHEVRLRQLMDSNELDFGMLVNAGIKIVKKDALGALVYIGKELGAIGKLSATEEGINQKLSDYKKFLAENKKEFIGSRIYKLDPPYVVGATTYTYGVNIYFYQ